MKGRMFRLRIYADRTAALGALLRHQIENLFERRNLELSVVLLRTGGIRLDRPQLFDLLQREIAREEAGDWLAIEILRRAARRELRLLHDVRRLIEQRFV